MLSIELVQWRCRSKYKAWLRQILLSKIRLFFKYLQTAMIFFLKVYGLKICAYFSLASVAVDLFTYLQFFTK